jgi:hypothetical protein
LGRSVKVARSFFTAQRLILPLAIVVALLIVSAGAGAAQPFRPTCSSGHTLFKGHGIRAFRVTFYDTSVKGEHEEAFVCIHRSVKPRLLYDPGPFCALQVRDLHILGQRLGFVADIEGFDNGSETDVGWLDLRSGKVRFGIVNAGVNADRRDPLLPDDQITYAFAPDGATAVIAGNVCQVVAVLDVRAKLFEDNYALGPPVVLYTAPAGGLDPHSLAIDATTVTWATLDGTPASAVRATPEAGVSAHDPGCAAS